KGGASTITQQLAKLFFTDKPGNSITRLWQKLQEWLIAIELEKRYTKEEIIAIYLHKFDFLYNSYGIESASRTYFGKSQKDLSTDEAATLIAMLKWPIKYNPKRHPEKAKARRNVVLNQMRKYGYLKESEYKELITKELDNSNFKSAASYKGPAPYFRAELLKWVKNLLEKPEYRKQDGTKYNINLDGLKIYTTIDLDYQLLAEKAVYNRMKGLQKVFDKVWSGKDPWFYGANKKQKQLRKKTLNRFIKESDRFRGLRQKILEPVIDSIKMIYPEARLWDTDIQRMLNQEKDNKYLDNLKSKGYVTSDQILIYKKIMAGKFWKLLKAKQKELNQAVKKSFNKKTKMKVFAYNDKREKIVNMTPLDSIKYHKNFLQTGMLAIDPHSGYIKAWVGGIDFKYFKFDHINSKRQVGSTFKPFIYATAIFNKGISPCMKVQDIQYSITPGESDFGLVKTWRPGNAEEFSNEYLTLYEGLRQSKNSVSVYLMKELGNVDIVRDFVDKLGIDKNDIPRQPSICLGSADLSVMQMTGAYSVFSNKGVYNKPVFVTRIEDKNGKVIYNYIPEQHKAFPENYNYVMVNMLKYAAKIIQPGLKTEVGGKTG
ncbi:MAG TPA: peptidoglycan glycosyltransferase, partial [Bacteroidetes bacterium]|nr:peptidoglycan glycosyltransferase [Bacteroidota bacterium]